MNNYRKLALELVAYQGDGFAEKLVKAFEELHKYSSPQQAQDSAARKQIEKMARDRFKMNVILIVNRDEPPMCLPVLGNTNHVMKHIQDPSAFASQHAVFENALALSPHYVGVVNLNKATLGGEYSKLPFYVVMGQSFCRQHLGPRCSAATFLHEIGHGFVALEFMFRTMRVSQVLANLHQVRTGRDNSITYVHAVKIAGEKLYSEKLITAPTEFEELVEMHDDTAIVSIAYARTWRKLCTDFGAVRTTGFSFEALADNFTAKLGMAADLTEAFVRYGELGIRSDGISVSLSYLRSLIVPFVFPAVTTVVVAASGAALPVAVAVGIVLSAVTIVACIATAGYSDLNTIFDTYGKDTTRVNRLREAVIGALKQKTLTTESRQKLLDQIAAIDKILKNRTDADNVWSDIANFVFSERRNTKNALKLERDLEFLANNNLFVSASALKQLT